MNSQLDRLAREHGISLTRPSPENSEVPISNETKRMILAALGADEKSTQSPLSRQQLKAIPKSYLPEVLEADRVWGISLQLYELRSARNWGIGDFEDLIGMIRLARLVGADFIGLNPLHAPFFADPNRCSPYEPSNRQMLNPLYIAVDKITGFENSSQLEERLQSLRKTELVDYVGVAKIKMLALQEIWRSWQDTARGTTEADAFEDFIQMGGDALRRHAVFESISAFMIKEGHGAGWTSWPNEYQSPNNLEVEAFSDANADTVRFHMWLQWLAHLQLTKAAETAGKARLRIGLYLDLAVGEAIDGSATWSEREVYISDATVGSPPDPFATEGQDWHLAAFHPSTIASGGNSPYRRMVTAAMRYAGAVRIDHAAALRRLFLVPLDRAPDAGAYVNYPQADLLQILSEASAEFRCLVIGEDLGMLPEGLQDDLAEACILSYRILSYERDDSGFKPADAYPRLSLACISTHDHQTLEGWWRGADIKARKEHGIVPLDVTETHIGERDQEREDLRVALDEAGVEPPARLPHAKASDDQLRDLVISAHRFIAKTPSVLVAVRLADMTNEKRPTNIPGTSSSYPNWKPKLSLPVEALDDLPLLQEIAKVMRNERSGRG